MYSRIAALIVASIALLISLAIGAVPGSINYQGRLTTASGQPVTDGIYSVAFSIYDDPVTGVTLWSDTLPITTTGGIFSIALGDDKPISPDIAEAPDLWLGLAVEGEPELTPRQKFISVPYAFRAVNADTASYASHSDTSNYAVYADSCNGGSNGWIDDGNVVRLANVNDSVGIGTSTPDQKLHVKDGRIKISHSTSTPSLTLYDDTDDDFFQINFHRTGERLEFKSNANDEIFVLKETGNIGIGTISPARKLSIVGDFSISTGQFHSPSYYAFLDDGSAAQVIKVGALAITSSYSTDPPSNGLYVQGNVGIGTTNPEQKLHVAGFIRSRGHSTDPYYADIGSQYNYNESFRIRLRGGDASEATVFGFGGTDTYLGSFGVSKGILLEGLTGNVGIGTTSPTQRLSIEGGLRSSNGSLYSPVEFRFHTDASTAQTIKAGALAITSNYVNNPPSYGLYVQGNVGIGTTAPDARLAVSASSGVAASFRTTSSSEESVWAYNNAGTAISGGSGSGSQPGVEAISDSARSYYIGLKCYGYLVTTGVVNPPASIFTIDHPLDPTRKNLNHSAVSSPDMMNVYNGNAICGGDGRAIIELPDYFESLNRDFRYQLTCIGDYAPVYIEQKISGNRFIIAGGKPGLEISWQVTGIRKDPFAEANRIPVEKDKPLDERGKYLHPEAYGVGPEQGVDYEVTQKMMRSAQDADKGE